MTGRGQLYARGPPSPEAPAASPARISSHGLTPSVQLYIPSCAGAGWEQACRGGDGLSAAPSDLALARAGYADTAPKVRAAWRRAQREGRLKDARRGAVGFAAPGTSSGDRS